LYGLVDEGVTESTLLESDMDNILVLLASLCFLNPLGQLFLINPSPPPFPHSFGKYRLIRKQYFCILPIHSLTAGHTSSEWGLTVECAE